MVDIGSGLWNLRGSFTFLVGMVDIGTQMSFIRLSTGKFLVIDTCAIGAADKTIIDKLTNNGELIEAVVATHPFHTMFFEPFFKMYPNAEYYGTPRHLNRITSIPWKGNVAEEIVLKKWEHEGVFMRIPDGADFVTPAEDNHFSGVFVFHQASKTVLNDDTILFFDQPGFVLRCCGKSRGGMEFWDLKKGLKPTKTAPGEFKAFMEKLIADWDFDNLAAAHTGILMGGAREKIADTIKKATPAFEKIAKANK